MTEPTEKEIIIVRKLGDGFVYRDRAGNEIVNLPPVGKEPPIITALEKGKPPCPLSETEWDKIAEKLNVPVKVLFSVQNGESEIGQFSAPTKVLADNCPKDKTASR